MDRICQLMLYVGVCYAAVSVPCCLAVNYWERADILAVFFVIFPNVFWSTSELRMWLAS